MGVKGGNGCLLPGWPAGLPCPPMSGSSDLSPAWPWLWTPRETAWSPAPGDPHAHSQGHPSTTGAWGAQAVTERGRVARQRWRKGFRPAHPFHLAGRVAGIHVALRQVRDVKAFLCTPVTAPTGPGPCQTCPWRLPWGRAQLPPHSWLRKTWCGAVGTRGATRGGLAPGSERRMRHILATFTPISKRICVYD